MRQVKVLRSKHTRVRADSEEKSDQASTEVMNGLH